MKGGRFLWSLKIRDCRLFTNYEAVLRDVTVISDFKPDLVILDEAQRIKNFSTKTAEAVKRLSRKHAMVIFSEWTTMTYLIARHLSEIGIPFVELSGKIPVKKRQALIVDEPEDPSRADSEEPAEKAPADEPAPEKMEEVLNSGMAFIGGLLEVATGKKITSSVNDERMVKIDKTTGEVTLKFKLPGF